MYSTYIMVGVTTILTSDMKREMPVFGFVQGHIVTGVIDELIREFSGSPDSPKRLRSLMSTPRKCKKRCQVSKPSEGQSLITSFASTSGYNFIDLTADEETKTEDPATPRCYQHTLRLIDTKTRRSNSLPSDEDALASRLQLMLYHRLLSSLISSGTPFDFTRLWDQTNVDPALPFSERFLTQTGSLPGTPHPAFTCLDDLTILWRNTILELDIPSIDPCLQLIYRHQHPLKPKEDITVISPPLDPSTSQSLSSPFKKTFDFFDIDTEEESVELLLTLQESWLMQLKNVSGKGGSNDIVPPSLEASASASTSKVVDPSEIIDTKEFNLDDDLLNSYLTNVLDWWMGRRRPIGVSVTQTRRCNSCEYMSDCEWRAEKASEIKVQTAERRAKSVSPLP
ncbi:exonuclease V [Desarmillaria ectypa]|nr:exonuclease V [Desarmillaria ectypa]